ncbi:hypothetical protein [Vibrio parahaemolyticus]|uniref:hypothetical protein n=1 Tax=Vibrio parahaemolyticus TaxID=670 RepID=UPI0011407E20|nr:hypothetical protein [Vibrio parahaemolyticus]MDG2688745.1 hypothetical protein [Vibrio parahaemolyticus]QDG82154.1 hypothetical protein FKM99_00735 [Vibrio parahaemolyticus]
MAGIKIKSTPQVSQQVGPTVLQNQRVTGADFGGEIFSEAEKQAAYFTNKVQNQVDVAQSNKMKNDSYVAKNQMVNDFLQQSKGENVFSDAENLKTQMKKWDDDYLVNVPERYKDTFKQQSETSDLDWDRVIQRHQNTEAEKFKVAQHDATQKNSISFVGNNYDDYALVDETVREGSLRQIAYDKANGLPDEAIKNNTLSYTTAARATALDQLISVEKFNDAKSYLDKYKEQIDPAVRAKYSSRINTAIKSRNAASKKEYTNGVQNYLAYLQDGNEPQLGKYSKEQLVSVYGKDQGEKVYDEISDYEKFAESYQTIQFASPDEVKDLLGSEKPTGPEDYTREERQYSSILKAISARNKAIASDPAKFVMKNDLVSNSFKSALDSGDFSTYAQTTIAEQERLGVPPGMTRILDKDSAKNIVMKYNQGGEGAASLIENLKTQYGQYFPQVMKDLYKEKLPANVSTVAVLGDSPAATYLSEADRIGFKTLKENIGNDNYKEVQTNVNGLLDGDYLDSVIGLANQSTIKKQITTSVETLAMYYMDNGLADGSSDAADKAFKEIISDRYQFRQSGDTFGLGGNTYRVPNEINGKQPNVDVIDGALDGILDLVPKMSLMAPADPRIQNDEMREKVYKRRLHPRWLTRGDDAGVELVDQNNVPVLTVDGRKIFYSWDDLENVDVKSMAAMYGGFK